MEDAAPYQYSPLQGPKSIRILRLYGGASKVLFAELIDSPINGYLPYEAISYCWGTGSQSHALSLRGGMTLKITRSLYNALRDIRHSKTEHGCRDVWADAVCINQLDTEERSKQVGLMAEIYGSARRVITYTGEDTVNVKIGMYLAVKLILFNEIKKYANLDKFRFLQLKYPLPREHDPAWASLRAFLGQKWYTRMWIVQESLLNDNMIMMCGNVEICWDIFMMAARLAVTGEFIQYAAITPTKERQLGALVLMPFMREIYRSAKALPFPILADCRELECEEPKDHVYAMSSLLSGIEIVPDYEKSTAVVYRETAELLLRTYGMEMLSYAGTRKREAVPSWVPDWSVPVEQHPILRFGPFRASMGLAVTGHIIRLSSGSLILSGKILESIVHVTGSLRETLAREQYLRLSSSDVIYPGGGTYLEAFWRTLILNKCAVERIQKVLSGPGLSGSFTQTIASDLKRSKSAPASLGRDFEIYVRPVASWAKEEAKEGLARQDPRRIPKPPDISPMIMRAWERDLNLNSNPPNDTENVQSVFSSLRQGAASNGWRDGDRYRDAIIKAANLYRKLFTTKSGYIGMSSADTRVNDVVAFFPGANVPFVLRPKGADFSQYELVGDCYVHGLMQGEIAKNGGNDLKDVILV